MIEVFENGLDMHRMTASLIFHKHYDDVSDEPGEDGEPSERDWAKRANHGFNYGYGPHSFSLLYEVPLSQAKWIHQAYHAAYPGVERDYWGYVQRQLKQDRTLTNLFDRKTQFLGKWSEKLLHEAYSCIPQGTCGDLVNDWGLNFIYYNDDPLFKHVELLTQIHDSIDFQIPLSLPIEAHAKILIKIKQSLEHPIAWRNKKFSIPADLTVNTHMYHKKEGVKVTGKTFTEDVLDLADTLEAAIRKLGLEL